MATFDLYGEFTSVSQISFVWFLVSSDWCSTGDYNTNIAYSTVGAIRRNGK